MGMLRELFREPRLEPGEPFPAPRKALYWQPDQRGIVLVSKTGETFVFTRRKGWQPSPPVDTSGLELYAYE